MLIALLNRNPAKRLGSGSRDCEDIKEHAFFTVHGFSWDDVANRRTHPPKPYTKRILM